MRADSATSEQESDAAFALSPGDTGLCEELIPLLDRADFQELADRVFRRHFERLESQTRKFPDSAMLHNNIAWLAARSHRNLDEALKHADRAVALTPANAGHIDTLAEVQFHRGEREAALHTASRALELAPAKKHHTQQLNRFQTDPLPTGSSTAIQEAPES